MNIQSYSESYATEITHLFHCAVHGIDPSLYSLEEQEAWAPSPPNYTLWAERLRHKRPYVALIDRRVAGFIELDDDGHIDCFYVHPDYQRLGVGLALYKHALRQASAMQLVRIYVEASHVAKPFFERQGFIVVETNTVQRNGVALVNFTMELYISC